MATKTRAQLIAQGQQIKNETTADANTAARVGLSIEEVAENSYNVNDDDLATSAQLTVVDGKADTAITNAATADGKAVAAQTDATQALSDASDASDEAAAAQTTADTADGKADANAAAITALRTTGSTVTNELTFDEREEYYDAQLAGTPSFTLASSGNVDGYTKRIILDQPSSVAFSSDFLPMGNIEIDPVTTPGMIWIISMEFVSDINGAPKVLYTILPPIPSTTDITGPSVLSITVFGANQDQFSVLFDEAVTIADLTALSLTGTSETLQSVTGSGTNTLTFTASGNIYFWEDVSFIWGASNTIEDLANNSLSAGAASVVIQFTDFYAYQAEIANYWYTNETPDFNRGSFTFWRWIKGVNHNPGTSTWNIIGTTGPGGDTGYRVIHQNTLPNILQVDFNDTLSNQFVTRHDIDPSIFTDGNHHLIYCEYDYINKTVAVYVDNVLLNLSQTIDSQGFDKATANQAPFIFSGSNAAGGDIGDDLVIYKGLLNSTKRGEVWNGGEPANVFEILEDQTPSVPYAYITHENQQIFDAAGNFTFTQFAAGGSFVTDTPTNPA